jgi:hypothetical protein
MLLMSWHFAYQSATKSAHLPWSLPNSVRYAFLVSPHRIASGFAVFMLSVTHEEVSWLEYRTPFGLVCVYGNKRTCYRAVCQRLARLLPFAIVVQVLMNSYLSDRNRRPQTPRLHIEKRAAVGRLVRVSTLLISADRFASDFMYSELLTFPIVQYDTIMGEGTRYFILNKNFLV